MVVSLLCSYGARKNLGPLDEHPGLLTTEPSLAFTFFLPSSLWYLSLGGNGSDSRTKQPVVTYCQYFDQVGVCALPPSTAKKKLL